MARPRRNTATAVAKADTAETVQAVKKESAVCAAEEKGTVSAAAQKDAACVSEKKGTRKPRRHIWQPIRALESRPWSFIFRQSRMRPTTW